MTWFGNKRIEFKFEFQTEQHLYFVPLVLILAKGRIEAL
jgi:hypothetical protein